MPLPLSALVPLNFLRVQSLIAANPSGRPSVVTARLECMRMPQGEFTLEVQPSKMWVIESFTERLRMFFGTDDSRLQALSPAVIAKTRIDGLNTHELSPLERGPWQALRHNATVHPPGWGRCNGVVSHETRQAAPVGATPGLAAITSWE